MQWHDQAIVISAKKHGEHALILQLLTFEHGLHAGLMRSARKAASICQPGNVVEAVWKARLEDHLGHYSCELTHAYSALFLQDSVKLSTLNSASILLNTFLPEREPYPEIYECYLGLLKTMVSEDDLLLWGGQYVLLELELLQRMGYGLDVSVCAVSGKIEQLTYVSPKSGRAVNQVEATPYRDKLLPLPPFLRGHHDSTRTQNPGNMREIIDGLALTRYFLEKHVVEERRHGLPKARERLVTKLLETCE